GQPYSKFDIWKFGSIEFYFPRREDGLYMIFSDHLNPLTGEPYFELDNWILPARLTVQEAEKLLHEANMPFIRENTMPVEAVTLKLASQVRLSFYPAEGEYLLNTFYIKI